MPKPRGIFHHSARLDEAKVLSLRADREAGMGWRSLGRRYGITPQSAKSCATGETWKHVTEVEDMDEAGLLSKMRTLQAQERQARKVVDSLRKSNDVMKDALTKICVVDAGKAWMKRTAAEALEEARQA